MGNKKKIVDHGFIFCLKLLLIMKKHLFDVQVEQIKKILCLKKQGYFNLQTF